MVGVQGKNQFRAERHRYRGGALTTRQETVVALVFGLVGLFVTLVAVSNLDSLRAAFAEWGTETELVATLPAGE